MSDQSNNTDELDFIARMAMAVASRDSGSQAVGVASYARTMMDGVASSYHCGKPAHGVGSCGSKCNTCCGYRLEKAT